MVCRKLEKKKIVSKIFTNNFQNKFTNGSKANAQSKSKEENDKKLCNSNHLNLKVGILMDMYNKSP